jgi:sRNA-binding protein
MTIRAEAEPAPRKLTLSPTNLSKVMAKLPPPLAASAALPDLAAERKARRRDARERVEALLRDRFPLAFCGPPRVPLAIGTFKAIRDAVGGEITPKDLGAFLSWWTGRDDYLDRLAHGVTRVNLDGSPAGSPTEAERWHAAEQAFGPRAKAVMARIAAQKALREAQRPLLRRPRCPGQGRRLAQPSRGCSGPSRDHLNRFQAGRAAAILG